MKNTDKKIARQGIVLLMDQIEEKMRDTMDNGTKSVVGALNPAAELEGYANVLSNLADSLNKLS